MEVLKPKSTSADLTIKGGGRGDQEQGLDGQAGEKRHTLLETHGPEQSVS